MGEYIISVEKSLYTLLSAGSDGIVRGADNLKESAPYVA